MTKFTTHTAETAPAESKAMLEGAQAKMGFVPNIFGNMAEAPALLEGYMVLAGTFDNKSSLDDSERQIVTMTNNVLNGCTYCMAAHTVIAQGQDVPDDVINALRDGTPLPNEKLEALRTFSRLMNEKHGRPSEAELQAFFDAGYTQQAALEVVVGTALKVMSNYTNAIAGTQVDEAFAPAAWAASCNKAA